MSDAQLPPEWIRAVLAHSVLAIIAAEETTYGYRILQRLEEAGFGKVKGGTLYPILARFERDGWVTSSWGAGDGGPGRKFVSITAAGRREIDRRHAQWQVFSAGVDTLWATPQDKGQQMDGWKERPR